MNFFKFVVPLLGLLLVSSGTLARVPEAEALDTAPLSTPAGDDIAYIQKIKTPAGKIKITNGIALTDADSYNLTVIGKHVVIAPNHPNKLFEDYLDSKAGLVINKLEIHAEKLELRGNLKLPYSSLVIYARELEMNGKEISIEPPPQPGAAGQNTDGSGKNGAQGWSAKTVELYLDPSRSSKTAGLLLLKGGKGQEAGPGTKAIAGSDYTEIKKCEGTVPAYYHAIYVKYNWCKNKVGDSCLSSSISEKRCGAYVTPDQAKDALSSGVPGKGGKGGTVKTNLSRRDLYANFFPDFTGGDPGKSGPSYDGATAGKPVYWSFSNHDWKGKWTKEKQGTRPEALGKTAPVGQRGEDGVVNFLDSAPYIWLRPDWMRMVLSHARDSYRLHGDLVKIHDSLVDYLALLDTYNADTAAWTAITAGDQSAFDSIAFEMKSMVQRIESNLDYFGNPSGWVPLLAFDVQYALFENEIGRATNIMALATLVGDSAQHVDSRKNAIVELKGKVREERVTLVNESNTIASKVTPLHDRLVEVIARTDALVDYIKKREEALAQEASGNISEQQNTRAALKVMGALCKVVPVGQPALYYAGTAIDAYASYDPDKPWGTILQLGVSLSGVPKELKSLSEDWKSAKEGVEKLEDINDVSKISGVLDSVQKSVGPLQKRFQSVMDGLKPLRVSSSAVNAELAKLRARDALYRSLVNQVEQLLREKQEIAQEIDQYNQQLNAIVVKINSNLITQAALANEMSDISAWYDPRVASYIRDMSLQSEERLERYRYYMAKAYEYRYVKRYPSNVDLKAVHDKINKLIKNVDPNSVKNADYSETLFVTYKDELTKVSDSVISDYQPPRTMVDYTPFELDAAKLDVLNQGGVLHLNLLREKFPSPTYEDLRLVDVQVLEVGFNFTGASNERVLTTFAHNGISLIEKDGRTLMFNHYRNPGEKSIIWSTEYDLGTSKLIRHTISVSASSFLATLLDKKVFSDMVAFVYPGMWADIDVSTDLITGSGRAITKMVLGFKYEYMVKKTASSGLRVGASSSDLGANLQPLISVDVADQYGRTEGDTFFFRAYEPGKSVTLTAQANYGSYKFAGWNVGKDAVIDATSLSYVAKTEGGESEYVTAMYTVDSSSPQSDNKQLSVSKSGSAGGTITSSPSGLDCGSVCSADYLSGTTVTLTAKPDTGGIFSGWGGACGGTGACAVYLAASTNVTASFAPIPSNTSTLSLTRSGDGFGTISSLPVGIDCGTACIAAFQNGTSVTLTATHTAGSKFDGWSGDCSGLSSCVVAMNAAKNVSAKFTVDKKEGILSIPLVLVKGWNLLGNSLSHSLPVASIFGDAKVISTVWKWDVETGGWQFYSPLLSAEELQTFTTSNKYGVLSEIKPGEGYWVKASASASLNSQEGLPFES